MKTFPKNLTTVQRPFYNNNQFGIVSVLANAGKDIEVTVENLRITGAFSSNYDVGGGISASAKYHYGGGIFIEAHSFGFVDATILNSIISNNEAMLGGGIAVNAWCEGYYPDVRPPARDVKLNIINTTITKNTAKNLGIYGGGKGGGLKLLAGYGATKRNDGSIEIKNGSIETNILNSIIWGNAATYGADIFNEVIYEDRYGAGSSIANVSYSDIGIVRNEDGSYNIGQNVFNVDPLFADPENGSYRLKGDSKLIDVGTSDGAPSYDFDGTPRPAGNGVDIGAYEVPRYSLLVILEGSGTGNISTDGGIDCGSDCQESFNSGLTVTLSASPNEGSFFCRMGRRLRKL